MNNYLEFQKEYINSHPENNICMCKDSIICYCKIAQEDKKKELKKIIHYYPDYISGRGCDTA